MNLKYYLRGLGLGIVITAILLGITVGSAKESLTDDEIIVRAKTLGMVEDSVLTEYVEKAKSDTEAKLRTEIEEELRNNLREEIRAEVEAESALQVEESVQEPEPASESVEFIVYKGDLPQDISGRLEQAGLVESASEFEKFLLGNGYDRSIVASKYTIPGDADKELIARIITGHKAALNE